MIEHVILDAGGVVCLPRMGNWLTTVRFEEIVGPARLAIACDPRRSPDRGSLALIAELARSASDTRVWLLQAPPGQALDAERLGDWHAALQQLEVSFADCAPLSWLETGHD